MQVVVLAGGIGSRLRPWTNDVPKPLLPMLDATLLERVVEGVPSDLVDEVIVAGGYKVELIREYFAKADVDFDVRIVPEDQPLGTGGALGNCRDIVSGRFACFNGDIISSLDASTLLDLHKKNKSVGTLGLWEVEDPTRFGIVGLDENHRITRFKEKPKPEEVFSNLINAGSYIFNDDVFDWMPKGKHSIEREVFPKLAKEGLLSGEAFDGYFIDAGTPSAWNQGVKACIEHHRYDTGSVVASNWFQEKEMQSEAYVTDSMISKSCVLGNGRISQSRLLSSVVVEDQCHLDSCLVGEGFHIGPNCNLDGVVIDHGSRIPKGTVQSGGQWPHVDGQ